MDENEETLQTLQELIDALVNGAVVFASDSGDITVGALDDLPPSVRECVRASRHNTEDWAQTHRSLCPDCLENEAAAYDMDATSWRDEGNVSNARILESEAAELRLKAARIRSAGQ